MNGNDENKTVNFTPPERNSDRQPTPHANKQTKASRIVTLAVFVTIIAAMVLLCCVIISEIVYKVSEGPANRKNGAVTFETYHASSAEKNSGLLLDIGELTTTSAEDTLVSGTLKYVKDLKNDSYATSNDRRLSEAVIPYLNEMLADLKKSVSADEYNVYIYGAYIGKSAIGGFDTLDKQHLLGTVVDLLLRSESSTDSLNVARLNWLNEHSSEYGFINSDYTGNIHDKSTFDKSNFRSTQFRYVGTAHATYIYQNRLTLSNYLGLLKLNYTKDAPLAITGVDGCEYEVYYVASAGDWTDVPVPSNYEYTLSGNNTDGYIVTVNLSEAK